MCRFEAIAPYSIAREIGAHTEVVTCVSNEALYLSRITIACPAMTPWGLSDPTRGSHNAVSALDLASVGHKTEEVHRTC